MPKRDKNQKYHITARRTGSGTASFVRSMPRGTNVEAEWTVEPTRAKEFTSQTDAEQALSRLRAEDRAGARVELVPAKLATEYTQTDGRCVVAKGQGRRRTFMRVERGEVSWHNLTGSATRFDSRQAARQAINTYLAGPQRANCTVVMVTELA